MVFFDILLVLIGFLFLMGIATGIVLVVFQITKQKIAFWPVFLYSLSLLFLIVGLFEVFLRFWEGALLIILGFVLLPRLHKWIESKFNVKHIWLIVSALTLLVISIFIPVNKYYAEINAKEQSEASKEELKQNVGEVRKHEVKRHGYITHGGFMAAIDEAHLDQASMYVVDSDQEGIDRLIKEKMVFYLKPNIEVDLVQESSITYNKVELTTNDDKQTFWVRREAIGESFSKEISKEQYGKKWPFTVNKGTLRCTVIKISHLTVHCIVFIVDGKSYAINGTAKNWAKRNGYNDGDGIFDANGQIGLIIEDGTKLSE